MPTLISFRLITEQQNKMLEINNFVYHYVPIDPEFRDDPSTQTDLLFNKAVSLANSNPRNIDCLLLPHSPELAGLMTVKFIKVSGYCPNLMTITEDDYQIIKIYNKWRKN